MKKILLFIFVIFSFRAGNAQDEKPNVIKLNLSSILLSNVSMQYERGLKRNMSVAMGISVMPGRGLPGILIDEAGQDIFLENLRLSGFAITPEFRFYPGKKQVKQAPRGFYLAPYMRYSNYTAKTLYEWDTDEIYDFKFKWTGFGIGFMIGSQWYLGNRVSFDWWILGGHAGIASPKITVSGDGMANYTPAERDNMVRDIEEFGADLPMGGTVKGKFEDDKTVSAKFTGVPFIGIRGNILGGFTLGIAF